MINLDDRFRIPDHVFARDFDGEMVLLDINDGLYYGLNAVGSAVWKGLCDGGKTAREVARDLLDDYDVEERRLLDDIVSLASDWVGKGLVSVR